MSGHGAWEAVTGAETLREFMSGLTVEGDLPSKEVARGAYQAGGTGVLLGWGDSNVPRLEDSWRVR